MISEGTWLNVNVCVKGMYHIDIGDNCYIGRRNFFSPGKQIVVGDYFMSGIDCRFISAGHKFEDPLVPYVSTSTTDDKKIIIETNVWCGTGVTIVGDINIGRGSIIGAGALVNSSIPPFSIVVGNPSKVIRRYSFVEKMWISVSELCEKMGGGDGAIDEGVLEKFLNIPTEAEYNDLLKKKGINIRIPYQASSRRFGDLP